MAWALCAGAGRVSAPPRLALESVRQAKALRLAGLHYCEHEPEGQCSAVVPKR